MLFIMKKQGLRKFGQFILTIIFSLGIAQVSFAQNYGLESTAGKANYDISGNTNVYSTVTTVIQGFLAALSILFFIYITYAGILWMKARGNENLVKDAKEMIIGAIIGLAIVMSAYGLTTFVLGKLNR